MVMNRQAALMSDQLNTAVSDVAGVLSTIPGTRMKVDWPKLVSGQDIILTTPPQDTLNGLRLGNGDIGVSVFGSPECITLHVGKNDILDYRCPMDEKRPLPQKEFIERYGNLNKPPITKYLPWLGSGVDDPENAEKARLVGVPMPSGKPAGKVRIRNSSLAGVKYCARLHLWDAEVTIEVGEPAAQREGQKLVTMRTFVSYPRNLIIVEYTPSGQQQFDLELARHKDSTGVIPDGPEFGTAGRDMWLRYKFPADPLNYPKGFEYVMYTRVIGGEEVHSETEGEFSTINQYHWTNMPTQTVEGELRWLEGPIQTVEGIAVAHVRSSRTVTLLVAVATTRDDADPFTRAREEVDDAQRAGLTKITREHQNHWRDYWHRSFVQLPEKPFVTQQWFVSQYHLACCWRPGRLAPGAYGPWIWEDFPGWGNDYHWDYNMQQAIWGAYSSNHLEQTVAYNEAALALLPTAQWEARETYGLDGAKFPTVSWPRKYVHSPHPWIAADRFMSINGWVAHPMWWYYLYSQDTEYLRTQAYPLMRECAKFYEGFVTLAPDGKYDVWPTAVWDIPLSPLLKHNKNCPMDLAFIRYLMKACITASESLGVDTDKRPTWQYIADNLHEYPTATISKGKPFKPIYAGGVGVMPTYTTTDISEGKVFVIFEGLPATYLILDKVTVDAQAPNTIVFPGDDIGLHSPQPLREIAWRTAQATPYYLLDDLIMLTMTRVRLGSDEMDLFEKNTRSLRLPNGGLVISGYRNSVWVNGFGWPIVINESILQSYTGQLRVAPVKLKYSVRFAQLRAVGAFLVSGEIRPGGDVAYIAITSEAGKPCSLIRPWDGTVRVRELSSMKLVKFEETDSVLSFQTKKGATYIVDRPGAPWEKQPITTIQVPEAEPEPM
jgi:hypothetical protein